jgi:peptidoglycan-associated lipoprotein
MKKQQWRVFASIFILLLLVANCSKKVTNVTPVPQPEVKIEQPVPFVTNNDEFKPIDMNARMRELLVPIYFDYDQSRIQSTEVLKLEKIAPFLRENPSVRVLIEGHCDERGSSEYNIGLGEKRAKAVFAYLSSYGIPQNRIETTSYGKERPAAYGCDNESCFSQNRRCEWKVISN